MMISGDIQSWRGPMNNVLHVETGRDWEELRSRNLMTVLDPMVLRTAELYFSGPTRIPEDERDAVWQAIDTNIGALMTFVDAVLLYDNLPVFSYERSFPESQLLTLDLLTDVLWPVQMHGAAYQECKQSAIEEIGSLRSISRALVQDVLGDLAAYKYEWHPAGVEHERAVDPRFYAFVLSGLMYDAYAQKLSVSGGAATEQAQRILQPKRAKMLAEVAIGHRSPHHPGIDPEQAVFEEIARLVPRTVPGLAPVATFPTTVTFLPLLLNQLDQYGGPADLLDVVAKYRNKGSVQDFRAWHARLREDLHLGRLPSGLQDDLRKISAEANGEAGSPVKFEVGLDALAVPAVKAAAEGNKLIGFVKQHLPGGRYQKLMYRALNAQNNYFDLSKRLRQVWFAEL
ncbi:hypothetical protein [Mycobacterium europaeum]|nr:hypothetical protein [Mycobacterium europaeum]